MEYFTASYKSYSSDFNLTLLKSRNREHLKFDIIKTYIEIYKIFDKIDNTDNRVELYNLNSQIEPLELKLQELWGFEPNTKFHRFWFESSKCTCPKMDNVDSLGTGMKYIDTECIIHGYKTLDLVQREKKLKQILK